MKILPRIEFPPSWLMEIIFSSLIDVSQPAAMKRRRNQLNGGNTRSNPEKMRNYLIQQIDN